MDETILRVLRSTAWERAKGELNAALGTFWDDEEGFGSAYYAVEEFIKKIEDDGLFQ